MRAILVPAGCEGAQGRVGVADWRAADGKLTLAELDRLAEQGKGVASGTVSLVFGTTNPSEGALAFLASDHHDAARAAKDSMPELAGLFSSEFDTYLTLATSPTDLRDRLATQLLVTNLIEGLGARVEWRGPSELAVDASGVTDGYSVDVQIAEQIRASFLVAGPLLARFGHVSMPPPGGDVIGRRRLDPHLDAFRALGATVEHATDEIRLEASLGLRPCDFLMDEPSVMATENALMAAALTHGPTVIRNAASEPHVQDVARMLVAMGATIDGIGSNVMTVHGLDRLRGCTHTIAPDHIEIGSFMALAGVTGGELLVKNTVPEDLRMIRMVFERLGLRSEPLGADIIVLLDSLTRVGRAFNTGGPSGGRTMSGGLDNRALEIPKRLFGAARKIEHGGSLTILATCLIDTGSRMDQVIFEEFKGTGNMELTLDRDLANQRIWPALDIAQSGTRKEEKLLDARQLAAARNLRRHLLNMPPPQAMKNLLQVLAKHKSNQDLFATMRI